MSEAVLNSVLPGYRAPIWLPGGHLQTIWAARLARAIEQPLPAFQRERWTTPDGDFIDVDFLPAARTEAPWLVMFHGLEGTSDSVYGLGLAAAAQQRGWNFAAPHFRGCSGSLNLAPRAYHSGDFQEVGWILQRLRQRASQPLKAVGISLGGNALLRWAQEAGNSAGATTSAVAAVCSPIDLTACGHAIDRGFNRLVYARMFLATMKPKALAKLAQYPGLFNGEAVRAARTLWEFDQHFTAPLHGFAGTDDYWLRASAKPRLAEIRIPALVLNARNDPFVPASCLPKPASAGPWVDIVQPAQGGHVGFPQGPFPGRLSWMPTAVAQWLGQAASQPAGQETQIG